MNTNKKILLGALLVTILIVIGGFAYVLTHKKIQTSGPNTSGLPFGNGGSDNALRPQETSAPDTTTVGNSIKSVNNLREISSTAVSGSTFIPQISTSSPQMVTFVERSTGHIFTANLVDNTITRISNTTIPKIEGVVWGTSGRIAVLRSLSGKTIESETIQEMLSASTSNVTLSESQLLPDILSIAISPKEDSIFYLVHGALGAEGYRADANGDNATRVFQFPTDEWNAEWGSGDTVYLTSKTSNGDAGYLYGLDTKSQALTLLLSNVPGLQARVSPDGQKIFYSSIAGTTVKTFIFDVKTKTSGPLSIQTLASKCAWMPDDSALYCGVPRALSSDAPDDWFKGLVSFDDDIDKVSLENGATSLVQTLTADDNGAIDVVDPHISQTGNAMTFMNKKDLSLWELDLVQ